MATEKTSQPKAPVGAAVDKEFGVGSLFSEALSWDDFSYNSTHSNSGSFLSVSNRADAVPMDKLQEMLRRDGQTRSLLRLFMLPILSCVATGKWIKDPDADYEDGDEEVDFANKMFSLPPHAGGMSAPLFKVMRQTLMASLFGFSAFEEVRQIPDKGPLKGKVTLRKLAYRHPKTIRFLVDEQGGFNGVRQITTDHHGQSKDVIIPRDKVWYYSMHEEENPLYGVSMFESSWYHYEIKTRLYFIYNIAAQFAAVSGRIGKYPVQATPEQKVAFDQSLKSFAFNTSLMLPDGFSAEAFNSSTGFDFLKGIEHHQHMQAKSMLMQFADTENRMVLIDNGTADASADMYVQSLMSVMDEIAESWSIHLLPKYIDWNFGSGKYPIWRFGELTDAHKDTIKDLFTTVVSAGMLNCTPEFVRELEKNMTERLGLDIDYDKIEEAEAEAAAQQIEQERLATTVPDDGTSDGEQAVSPEEGGSGPEAVAPATTGGEMATALSAEDWGKVVGLANALFSDAEDE